MIFRWEGEKHRGREVEEGKDLKLLFFFFVLSFLCSFLPLLVSFRVDVLTFRRLDFLLFECCKLRGERVPLSCV